MDKLICPNCESSKFIEKQIRHTGAYANEEFDVVAPTLECAECHEQLMNNLQMNQLRTAVVDAYREKHVLLTSKEIIGFRARLKMSQREFADYLGVGEASVKRWETYYAQERAMDEHVRTKCDPEAAMKNLVDVQMATGAVDEFTGNTKFSWNRFSNVVLALTPHCKSPLFINKALFYVDFMHYKKYGKSITGSRYSKLEYGPCPENYKFHFLKMKSENLISEKANTPHDLVILKKADLTIFDDNEKLTLNHIIELTKKDSGQTLYDLSHTEKAYTEGSFFSNISYNFAESLEIK